MISVYVYTEYGPYNVQYTKVGFIKSKYVDLAYIVEEAEDVVPSMSKTCVIANDKYAYKNVELFSGAVFTGFDKFFVESGDTIGSNGGHVTCGIAMEFCRKLYNNKALLNNLLSFRSFIVDSCTEHRLSIHFPALIWLLKWMKTSTQDKVFRNDRVLNDEAIDIFRKHFEDVNVFENYPSWYLVV